MPRKPKKQNDSAVHADSVTHNDSVPNVSDAYPPDVEPGISGIAESVPTSSASTAPTPVKDKLVVTLTDAGGLDLDGMRPKTKEKLLAALRKSQSGLLPDVPSAPVKRWPEFAVRGMYGMLGAAETAAAARKYPMEIAQAVFMFSDAEIRELMEPTQAVLTKHASNFDRWQEEISLGLVLIQIHFAKIHTLKAMVSDWEAKQTIHPLPANKPEDPSPIEGVDLGKVQ